MTVTDEVLGVWDHGAVLCSGKGLSVAVVMGVGVEKSCKLLGSSYQAHRYTEEMVLQSITEAMLKGFGVCMD